MTMYIRNDIHYKTDPASWVLNTLFPLTAEEYADQQAWLDAGAPEEPPMVRVLNAEQDRLFKLVHKHVSDYYAQNKPYLNSVAIMMAMTSLYGEQQVLGTAYRGAFLFAGSCEAMFSRLVMQGQGAMDFMRYNLAQEVTGDPMLAVIRAEQLCYKYGLRNHRTPTGDGTDIVFSLEPIANPVFDNVKYIPSVAGYYTIVGKGAARD